MSDSIGKGFNLVMELEDPSKLMELMAKLAAPAVKVRLGQALESLDYVHYARFLPLWRHGMLLIVTEFDGSMKDYVTDFAAVLDDEFSLILSYMKDRPRLPVSRYPDEFWAYVDKHTGADEGETLAYPQPFCAYPGLTVLEIAGAMRAKALPERPAHPDLWPALDAGDVQANVLRGYKARMACHLGLEFADSAAGRRLLRDLLPCVARQRDSRNAATCINVGVTHAGLQALGVAQDVLERFPIAFREGPRLRSARLGDTGTSSPRTWRLAGFDARGHPVAVHAMVSVYTKGGPNELSAEVDRVRELLSPETAVCFAQDAEALGETGEIHFGYRDGIAQPRIRGAAGDSPGAAPAEHQTPPGDLLLGKGYRNSRGGYYIGELPEALATNGTYAALRVIEQDVAAFDRLLAQTESQRGVKRETLAAKLMGRWPNGSSLALHPTEADREADRRSVIELDNFDYAAPPGAFDDREGRRCPIGAHIRRTNPRSGLVLGVPWGRRIVRRGMPYGPKFDPPRGPDGIERGLVGLFLCGDLESQFEFIQHVWANEDLSAPGLRNTQDPFIGARDGATPFRFRPRESEAEITVMVPPLTRTRGSAYFFMPGLGSLKWLADAGWQAAATC
jgi:deferrochelatase/peroxidase EfeB